MPKVVRNIVVLLFAYVLLHSLLLPSTSRAAAISLPVTGQTTCSDSGGTAIDCAGSGQDGEKQAGFPWPNPRFSENGDGTVTDALTGLIWTKDANLMASRDPSFDADETAGDGQVTWQHTLDYIKKLNAEKYLGFSDWHLPNINELKSLYNVSPSLNQSTWLNGPTGQFVNMQAARYWSSTAYATTNVWSVQFGAYGVVTLGKTASFYLWPVRGGEGGAIPIPATGQTNCWDEKGTQLSSCSATGQDGEIQTGVAIPATRFTNPDGTSPINAGAVLDNLTGLVWTQHDNAPGPAACAPGVGKKWQPALDYIDCLNSNSYLGYSDWRLPNIIELESLLLNYTQNDPLNPMSWMNASGFTVTGNTGQAWSSTSFSGSRNYAWNSYILASGPISTSRKDLGLPVWPVRAGNMGGGLSAQPGVVISPESRDFGAVDVGGSSSAQTITIRNSGTGQLTVSAVATGGTNAGDFHVASGGLAPCPAVPFALAPTLSCTMATSFAPAANGGRSATLTVTSNASPYAAIPLYGFGSDSGTRLPVASLSLPATNQTKCYDSTTSKEIACAGTGQDAAILGGIPWPNPRFSDNGNSTVTDALTGLIWTKDANLMVNRDPAFDVDGTANNGAVTWQHALDYIKKLNSEAYLGFSDWRLPNINELLSLVNWSQANPATWLTTLPVGLFNNVKSGGLLYYWSSTTLQASVSLAYSVDLSSGRNDIMQGKNYNAFLWPVRGGQGGTISLPATGQTTCWNSSGTVTSCSGLGLGQDGEQLKGIPAPVPRFSNPDGTLSLVANVLLDKLTGLVWSRNANAPGPAACVPGGTKTWQEALQYVACLNQNSYLGYSDWRLPNVNEMVSLVNYGQADPIAWLTQSGFTALPSAPVNWWYSTPKNSGTAGSIYITTANSVSISPGGSNYYVWPVRGGIVGTSATLAVARSGNGSGTVSSLPAGISCGITCAQGFSQSGTILTLTAIPDVGSAFTGWSGGGCSGTGVCTTTITSNTTITASFAKLIKITVTPAGSGSGTVTSSPAGIDCGSTCSGYFGLTSIVTLTALPTALSGLSNWQGCDSSDGMTCTINLLADRVITPYLSSKNATTLSLSLSSSAILNNGSVIASGKLTRLPDNGSDLSGQTVSVTIMPPASTSLQPFTVTATTDATGHYITTPVTGFSQKGAYSIQASSASTTTITAAASPSSTLMVGAQAGYAIIVQGKYPTGEGLAEHAKTTNRIYTTLKARGFSDDTILYLSYQDATSAAAAGVTVDGMPSRTAIQNAITSWAKDKIANVPAPLWVMMVDHGSNGNFYINNEIVTPADLNAWLTTLESVTATTEKRIVINGSCYSGSFIPYLAKTGRIIITSAAANEESYRGPLEPDGIRSGEYFLDNLFNQLKMGKSLKDAFDLSSLNTHVLTDKGGSNSGSGYGDNVAQHPLIDDSADNLGSAFTSNSGNGELSATIYLGTGQTITNAGEPADINVITSTTILIPGVPDQQLWLSTYGSSSAVDTAWVEVRSPGFTLKGAGGNATLQLTVDLPKLPMTFNSTTNRWKAVIAPYTGTSFAGFAAPGTYELFYYTRDLNGTIYTKRGVVYRQSDSNTVPNPFNLMAPADASIQKTSLVLSWTDAVDPDVDPLTYSVLISRDSSFATIDYLMEGLTNPITAIDQDAALADLTTYYWRVKAIDQYGGIRYSTQTWSFKTDNTNGLPSILKGYVRASGSGAPIANATISTGTNNYKTLRNGAFLFMTQPGSYTITAAATGYQTKSLSSVSVTPGMVLDASMSLSVMSGAISVPGDCDKDGIVTIAEVQSAINMFLGLKTAESCVNTSGDIAVSIAEVQKVINSFLGL